MHLRFHLYPSVNAFACNNGKTRHTSHPIQCLKCNCIIRDGRDNPLQALAQFLDKPRGRVIRILAPRIRRQLLLDAGLVVDHEHGVAALHETAGERGHGAGQLHLLAKEVLILVPVIDGLRQGQAGEHAGDEQGGAETHLGGVLWGVGEAAGEGVLGHGLVVGGGGGGGGGRRGEFAGGLLLLEGLKAAAAAADVADSSLRLGGVLGGVGGDGVGGG